MARRWSTEEDRALRRLYGNGRPVREIAARLRRSPDAVVARRRSLGVAARARSRPWSAHEQNLLRVAIGGGVPISAIAAHLDRSRDQVWARSRHLVARRPALRPYLPHEDDAIKRCVRSGGDLAALAPRLGRSPDAVRTHARQLGLYVPRPRRRWEDWEDATVRDGYTSALSCSEIARQLRRRTPGSVAARARKLGLSTYARSWNLVDDHRLAELSALAVPLEQAALRLGRTPEAVRRRAARLAIAPPPATHPVRKPRRWTPQEDELLKLHSALNPARLAQLLDRSDQAVTRRLRSLGLRRRATRSPHHTISRPQGRPTLAALRRLEYPSAEWTDGASVAGACAPDQRTGERRGAVL
jgi:hypothetical protein